MFDPEDDAPAPRDPRIGPRIGRIGFFLAAAGMGLASLSHLLIALAQLGMSRPLFRLLRSSFWDWAVITPATVVNAFAAYLLLGVRIDRVWRPRAALLALLQTYFLVYWCGDHAEALGMPKPPAVLTVDPWTYLLWRFLGFAGVLTLAWMAAQVARDLGYDDAQPVYRAGRGTIIFGVMLWVLFVARIVRWAPWPPAIRPFPDLETFFMYNVSIVCRALAGFFATALCFKACALSAAELKRLEVEMREEDPFVAGRIS